MTNWLHTIDIKPIIHRDQENVSPEHVVDVAHAIAALIRIEAPQGSLDIQSDDYDSELDDLVEELEGLHLETAGLLDDFNDLLNQFYDWADANSVWLGI
ncbi:hypothetical protein [Telmatospirillum sp.]|uniref:hypothetical protein n=1 Tax=Telmatospirillum sp. TaxID=2079197 RepID=UPI00284DD023|nr:hypothetical protein [Telmatospirillum sp.]MDR3436399.1 hypothetical protein [Telmatospirillum sp.]